MPSLLSATGRTKGMHVSTRRRVRDTYTGCIKLFVFARRQHYSLIALQ